MYQDQEHAWHLIHANEKLIPVHTFKILSKGKKRIQYNIWHMPMKKYII